LHSSFRNFQTGKKKNTFNWVFLKEEIHYTEFLDLQPYKITRVQETEESNNERRTHFVIGFCGQYMTVFSTKNTFFTDEPWCHPSGCINAQNSRYWSSINLKTHYLNAPS
jgi:hypothetical protein